MTVPSSCPLVGNQYIEDGAKILRTIHRVHVERTTVPVILNHNSKNPFDSNAIEVWTHLPWHVDAKMLGHLPKEVAAELAPLLDRGDEYEAEMYVRYNSEHPDNPGATIYLFKIVYK